MFQNKRFYISILVTVILLTGCQPKDTFKWNAGLSGPKNYIAGGPYVEYFYQGKSVAGASSGTGVAQGWGTASGGYVGGEKFKYVPDSISLSWTCGFDLIQYKGGCRLPRQKMISLFEKGGTDPFRGHVNYGLITAGMAPGGNVTVWLQGGLASTEVCRFKVKAIGSQDRYDPNSVTLWTSTGEEAKEILKYIYIHGISYKAWETGEKEYNYDIIFSNEADKTNYDRRITGISRDGSIISSNSNGTSFKTLKWNERFNARDTVLKFKSKLPIHIFLQWSTKDNLQWCESEIILPNDFEKRFRNGYINSVTGKKENYNRIIIGLEKEEKNVPFIFGKIWLSGKNKNEEIMSFRAVKFDTVIRKFLFCRYSLPKDFVFPKWEGRESLTKPTDFDYWQEK